MHILKNLFKHSFVLHGNDTIIYKNVLKELGGQWNRKIQGWMFPNKKINDVFEILGEFIKDESIKNDNTYHNITHDSNISRNENSDNNIICTNCNIYFFF